MLLIILGFRSTRFTPNSSSIITNCEQIVITTIENLTGGVTRWEVDISNLHILSAYSADTRRTNTSSSSKLYKFLRSGTSFKQINKISEIKLQYILHYFLLSKQYEICHTRITSNILWNTTMSILAAYQPGQRTILLLHSWLGLIVNQRNSILLSLY